MKKQLIILGIAAIIFSIGFIAFFTFQQNNYLRPQFNSGMTDVGVDLDGNGLFELLMANISINVPKSGNYTFKSLLTPLNSTLQPFNSTENMITSSTIPIISIRGCSKPLDYPPYASMNFWLWGEEKHFDEGINQIAIYFGGRTIYNSKTNGPYKVLFFLYDKLIIDSHSLPIISFSYVTQSYNYTQFQGNLIRYINATDYGEDIDNDGLFDYLTIELMVETIIDGNYSFYCHLYGDNVSYITESFEIILSKGIQKVPVRIDGYKIFRDRINTSYNVSLTLRDTRYTIYPADYSTSKYNYLEFQRPKAYFTGLISDNVLDKNGNGLFDSLILEAQLQVITSDNFWIAGSLEDYQGQEIVSDFYEIFLEQGIHTITLDFNGSHVYNHAIDGPYYNKNLRIFYNDTLSDNLEFLEYTIVTSNYNYQDFDPPTTNPPEAPQDITGPAEGKQWVEYTFNTSTTEPDGDVVRYAWDWDGDEIADKWTGFYDSGETCSTTHKWWEPGTYIIRVKAADSFNIKSGWSEPLTIVILSGK